jgi:DNA polymerase-3 subunit epsilon
MYSRAQSHFNSKESKGKKMLNDLYNVDFVKTGSELIALLLEAEEIKKHKPVYNRLRKASVFSHCIDSYTDDKGIINFKIVPYDDSTNPLQAFVTYSSAREKLERWLEEFDLCQAQCGLTSKENPCFNFTIKKCYGICCEKEEGETYNSRANKILEQYTIATENFILFDKGRNHEEKSMILIENSKYVGYGFLDSSTQISDVEELKAQINVATYYPDADDLLRGWLKANKDTKRMSI